jgi:anti-anti-sigma regulatory factor
VKVNITQAQGRVPVAVMAPEGNLDGSNYQELIAAAKKLCDGGATAMVLDLSGLEFVSSAGLLAIHSIALLLRGQQPPDPEYGWRALHDMAEGPSTAPSLKLAGPSPLIAQTLKRVAFDTYFEIHPDVETAVAAF